MKNKIWNKIKEYETIIIQRHIMPDGDAYGSQLGMKYLIQTKFPKKKVYAVGEEQEWLNYIGKMDNIKDDVYKNALVIVTDCGNFERISDQRLKKAKEIIKIDHHPDATPYGDISWVDTTYTSASEMVGDLAVELGLEITPEAARVIFHGIVTDSGRFLFPGTTARTFSICSKLISTNFDLQLLYKNLNTRKLSELKITNYIQSNFTLTKNGVAWIIMDLPILEELNIKAEFMNKYANVLAGFEEIKIWVTCSQFEEKDYRIEFRSASGITINQVAVKYGGGGHANACGAKANSKDEIKNIIQDLESILVK